MEIADFRVELSMMTGLAPAARRRASSEHHFLVVSSPDTYYRGFVSFRHPASITLSADSRQLVGATHVASSRAGARRLDCIRNTGWAITDRTFVPFGTRLSDHVSRPARFQGRVGRSALARS